MHISYRTILEKLHEVKQLLQESDSTDKAEEKLSEMIDGFLAASYQQYTARKQAVRKPKQIRKPQAFPL